MLKILLKSNCPNWNFVLVMSLENAFILQNNNNNKNSFYQQQQKFPFSTVIGKKIPIQGLNACTAQHTDTKIFVFFTLNLNNQSHSYETLKPIDLNLHH